MLREAGKKQWQEWLCTRPAAVRKFAAAHPYEPGDSVVIPGNPISEVLWFMGYSEYEDGRVGLIVTPIYPFGDSYDAAVEARQQICPDHL